MKKIVAVLLSVCMLLSVPHPAHAHAAVVACAPRIGTNLTRAPAQIVCVFDQPLYPDKLDMTVTAPDGTRVDRNDARPFEGDRFSVLVSLDTSKMANGIYLVRWRVTDTLDDGETSGTVQFGINTVVPPTPTVVLRGQVIVPPAPASVAPAENPATALISRFLIGLAVLVLAVMGFLLWRGRSADGADERRKGEMSE